MRGEGVVVENLDDGVVIYDGSTGQAHSLNGPAARVWSLADGSRNISKIAVAAGLDEAGAIAALDQLGARGLLLKAQNGVSRRWVLSNAAKIGGAAVAAVPLIETVIIPTAAAHASGGSGTPPPPPTTVGANAQITGPAGSDVTYVVTGTNPGNGQLGINSQLALNYNGVTLSGPAFTITYEELSQNGQVTAIAVAYFNHTSNSVVVTSNGTPSTPPPKAVPPGEGGRYTFKPGAAISFNARFV